MLKSIWDLSPVNDEAGLTFWPQISEPTSIYQLGRWSSLISGRARKAVTFAARAQALGRRAMQEPLVSEGTGRPFAQRLCKVVAVVAVLGFLGLGWNMADHTASQGLAFQEDPPNGFGGFFC